MKNFMDRTRFKGHESKMQARSAGLITVASTAVLMIPLPSWNGMWRAAVLFRLKRSIRSAARQKKPGDAKANQELVHKARELGQKMAAEMKQP